ncbi:MAG: hypothetical protein KGM47_12000, partial [Acidobacteriota bacterium]|nr:hypothetical protein [Acidobacteriota bacterium]
SAAYPSAAGGALALAIDPYYPPQIEQYSLGVQRQDGAGLYARKGLAARERWLEDGREAQRPVFE